MKIRQARKIFRRMVRGRKANKYIIGLKRTTYSDAIDYAGNCVVLAYRKRRKEAGE